MTRRPTITAPEFGHLCAITVMVCVMGFGTAHLAYVTGSELIRQHIEMKGPEE